jgi:pyruvate formate-lyase activating enzyme-like uncharacterized protein
VAEDLEFPVVDEYVEYVTQYDFDGVSVSGGEPLMDMERSCEFIARTKQRLGDEVHVWLYTNGLLATQENLGRLQDAGLGEIRFNLAAQDYCLDGLRGAVEMFDAVVVEIPAIPEDADLVKNLLPVLSDLGVGYLNIHQLWGAAHNIQELMRRGYSLVSGAWTSVIESELAALDLLEYAIDRAPATSVHYCSSAYKERYQIAAKLRCQAMRLVRDGEDVTEAGLIRQLSAVGSSEDLQRQVERLRRAGASQSDYEIDLSGGQLRFRARIGPMMNLDMLKVRLQYDIAYVAEQPGSATTTSVIPLSEHRSLLVSRSPVHICPELSYADCDALGVLSAQADGAETCRGKEQRISAFLDSVRAYEEIESGLPAYSSVEDPVDLSSER